MPGSRVSAALFAVLALGGALVAQYQAAPFDYYVLSLSWAPAFCALPNEASRNPQECAVGRKIGFIVHGLWPQAADSRSPESCGTAKPLPRTVVDFAMPVMLSRGLIRHEWDTHGICTGLTAFDYFSAIVQARASVQIPVQITSIEGQITQGPRQIETQFAGANPSFPPTAFRTSCRGRVFDEERICFNKNLKPRACTAAVGECTSPAIVIRPPL